MKNIFLILLNWNGTGDTISCLKSIGGLVIKGYNLSVVVVDNNSTDNSVEVFKKLKFDGFDFNVIQNSKNLGFAGGNNVGIKWAIENGADYVLVLNNDTRVDKNLITSFLAAVGDNKKFGVATGKIYFEKGFEFHKKRYKKNDLGKVIWSAGGNIDWNNVYGSNRGVDEVDDGQYDKLEETDFATGACSFFNVNALISVGVYDERYFAYLEDMELSEKLKRDGWKIMYVPTAKLWHKVSRSSAIGSQLNDYFITRNRLLFGMKYANWRARFALIYESLRFLINGRKWQKVGVRDFYVRKFAVGSWGK